MVTIYQQGENQMTTTKKLTKWLDDNNADHLIELESAIEDKLDDYTTSIRINPDVNKALAALNSIRVFCIHETHRLGYNPELTLEEANSQLNDSNHRPNYEGTKL